MFCSKCGSENSDTARYCSSCGQSLSAAPTANDDSEFLEVAIGPKNTDYYLSKFERFAAGGGFVSWNWPAFFVSLPWMLYRKMWAYAATYFLGFPIAVLVLSLVLAALLPAPTAATLTLLIELAAMFIVLPMFANALYYRVVTKRIEAAKGRAGERERQLRALAGEGGTSNAALIIVVVMIVPVIGILAAIAIPAYQDYAIRAQVAEGLNLAAASKAAVAEVFSNTGELPSDRSAAGLDSDSTSGVGLYVRSVAIANGRVDITYGGQANALLADKVLSLTPYAVQRGPDDWSIVWRCGQGPIPAEATHEVTDYQPGTLEPRYLPSRCRPQQ